MGTSTIFGYLYAVVTLQCSLISAGTNLAVEGSPGNLRFTLDWDVWSSVRAEISAF